ncbi:hypothetical protein IEE87_27120 (plasmid) [Klebsiella pneumoniae]|nr:hypothetical protein IEE87_27120 [Klebsiella pneumoniae]
MKKLINLISDYLFQKMMVTFEQEYIFEPSKNSEISSSNAFMHEKFDLQMRFRFTPKQLQTSVVENENSNL